jgi:hypothetical protein
MSKVGALAKLIKEGVTSNKIVGNPFSSKGDIENYFRSEIRRGALPKKNQKYFDTFDPNIYYHSTTQDIDKFNPQIDSSVGAYGDTMTRGATYFTSDRELADQVLQDKRILTQSEYLRQKLKMPSDQYPDIDYDTVYNPKTNQEYLSGSQIYPVKIKTDKLYDYTNKKHLAILEDAIEDELEFEKAIDFFEKTDIGSGDWRVLETPFIQTQLKKLGFSGYRTNEPGTVGLLNPDEGDVRSLYAKFDPKQAKSGEILASIVPYASVGTIGALAGLDEGT